MTDPQHTPTEFDIPAAPLPEDAEAPETEEQAPPTETASAEEEPQDASVADGGEPPEAEDAAKKDSAKKQALFAGIFEYAELFVLCLCTVLVAFSLFFRICTVSGPSMLPTLQDKELLFVSNLFYEPAQGDIVVFHQTSETVERFNEPIVKRVIATAGQTVRIDFTAATVTVDGVTLTEEYIQLVNSFGVETGHYTLTASHGLQMEQHADGQTHYVFEATVPEGTLFVMGDNRNNSADSRDVNIGFVDERRVLGRVICRLRPSERLLTIY